MTKDELMLEVLSRHQKTKTYHSKVVAQALGTKEASLIKKIRSLKCNEAFINRNFIGRSYNDADNTYKVYYDITKAGVMLLLLKQQSDDFRIAIIEKLQSYL